MPKPAAGASVTFTWGGKETSVTFELHTGQGTDTNSQMIVKGIEQAGVSIMHGLAQPEIDDASQCAAREFHNLIQEHTGL